MTRLQKLSEILREKACGSFLITDLKNIRYLTGFTGSSAYLLVMDDRFVFITDSRYQLQAKQEVDPACEIIIHKKGLVHELKGLVSKRKRLGFEPENLIFSMYSALKEKLEVQMVPMPGVVYEMRKFKTPDEIEIIIQAQAITDGVFEWVLNNLKPRTMTEADLALEMEYQMRKMGADGPAFDTIVATGPHSALPHAQPRNVAIPENTVLLMDFGAQKAYASDMTRTVWIGPKKPPEDFKRVYEIVAQAQKKAEEAIGAGLSCKQADALARDHIASAGYGEKFGHSLGHGVGLDVHELPRLSYLSEDVLQGGEVVTVEPGIYLEGQFGVRIEDMLWVKQNGSENLTGSPRELIVL